MAGFLVGRIIVRVQYLYQERFCSVEDLLGDDIQWIPRRSVSTGLDRGMNMRVA
jgi:hypothetical protein